MDEEQRNLINAVLGIKVNMGVFIEDQFTQQFHDIGDDLYDLVKRFNGDEAYIGMSGGKETAKLIIEICEKYLSE